MEDLSKKSDIGLQSMIHRVFERLVHMEKHQGQATTDVYEEFTALEQEMDRRDYDIEETRSLNITKRVPL